MPVSLPLTRSAGGGDLVGDGDLGDDQLVAVPVGRTRVAVQHRQTRGADRGVGLAVAPRPAHGVGDDDADGDARAVPAVRLRSARCAGVGIDRQQGEFGDVDVGAVDASGGLHQADRVLGDQRAALASEHPDRLGIDQLAAQRIPLVRVGRAQSTMRPSHLDITLLVTTTMSLSRSHGAAAAMAAGEVVAGPELG